MSPAQRRILAANKIDQRRNAAALGGARAACLASASERLAREITELPGGRPRAAVDPSLCHAARSDGAAVSLQAPAPSTT